MAPGRYLCRKFSGGRKKARYVARQAVRGPAVPLSILSWLLLAGLAAWLVLKFASPPTPDHDRPKPDETALAARPAESAGADRPEGARAADVQGPTGETATEGQVQGIVSRPLEPAAGPETAVQTAEAWLVIVESIPKSKRAEAERSQARHRGRGVTLDLFDTDAYPMLKSGMWTLGVGPYETRREAEEAAAAIRPKVRDLMIRRGL